MFLCGFTFLLGTIKVRHTPGSGDGGKWLIHFYNGSVNYLADVAAIT